MINQNSFRYVLNLASWTISCLILISVHSCTLTSDQHNNYTLDQNETIKIAEQIIDYEISGTSILYSSPNWKNSTFFVGLIELYQSTKDEKYLIDVAYWANQNKWKIGGRKYHADDQLAAYVYLSLYEKYLDPIMIQHTHQKMKSQIFDTSFVWWWADALFMAPPAFEISHSLNLIDADEYVFSQWNKTYIELYSELDSLFYRDKRYNNHLDRNKNKQFWLRGNGWVVAGLALQFSRMEKSDVNYPFYHSVFQKMTTKLINLYTPDQMWYMDILQPEKFPMVEVSGSALICYAITMGVTENLITHKDANFVIENCYKTISNYISETGVVEHVQPPNAKPENFDTNNSEPYGAGAVLLFLSAYFNFLDLES